LKGGSRLSLSKQVHIYSVDTSFFYNAEEMMIHNFMKAQSIYLSAVEECVKKPSDEQKQQIKIEKKEVNKRLKDLKEEMYVLLSKNKGTKRTLVPELLKPSRVVSLFESDCTRAFGMKENTLSEDVIIVQTYFFQVLEDLILNGFIYNGEKYICFTASAGQIRKKKTIFVKESVLNEHLPTLMCGLTLDRINEYGGVNVNKYLAYLALCTSATDVWKEFNIKKTIVIDDMELPVKGIVDYIDRDTYEIKRVKMKIPIEVTDGCGMFLPRVSKKNMMLRMPWVKGLLVSFPFDEFIREHNGNSIIKDIYGNEVDVIKDGIEVILTKSQFKMWKYYESWQEYVNNFIQFGCSANICNEEEDFIMDAKTNYQMLQTLTDITDDELEKIAARTNENIKNIGRHRGTMFRILGVTEVNKNKDYLQQALEIYPELLQDTFCRERLKETKKSLVKEARSGKLDINGKYTFVSPDLYAFCQRLFLNHKHPKGLLADGEVFCKIYKDGQKLDCLRAPHLFREHAVRNNVVDDDKSKWFITDAVYVSSHDLISKLIMNDWDGDKSLVCADPTLVEVAERNMKDVVPLYYKMEKAGSINIDNDKVFKGLVLAYSGGNIGQISNEITKIWNSENVSLDAIKLLCLENNFVIDYAKTLYKPERPKDVHTILSAYSKKKVPHFFVYAKDKLKKNVESINNSTVNRLFNIIKNPNIHFASAGLKRFEYTMLMRDKNVIVDDEIINAYQKVAQKKYLLVGEDSEISTQNHAEQVIRNELLLVNPDIYYVVDVLVKYLFDQKNVKFKATIWSSFGDIMIQNLKQNVLMQNIYCESCGDIITREGRRHKYCQKCWKEKQKEWQRESMRKSRKCEVL